MSQEDVLEILKARPEAWLSLKDIREALKEKGKSNGTLHGVPNDAYKLATFGYIEVRGRGLWKYKVEFKYKSG